MLLKHSMCSQVVSSLQISVVYISQLSQMHHHEIWHDVYRHLPLQQVHTMTTGETHAILAAGI